jgi:hypothetical protein
LYYWGQLPWAVWLVGSQSRLIYWELLLLWSGIPNTSTFPAGTGVPEGVEISRLLKGQRIRLGVVEQDAYGVGHLAVAAEDEVLRVTKGFPLDLGLQ